jgi:hypothetical protein
MHVAHNQASTWSHRSESVLGFYIAGIERLGKGVPSRNRGDMGGENVGVKAYIEHHYNHANRGSHLEGPSTHNQRIERLWRDVFLQVIKFFYNLFHSMEVHHVCVYVCVYARAVCVCMHVCVCVCVCVSLTHAHTHTHIITLVSTKRLRRPVVFWTQLTTCIFFACIWYTQHSHSLTCE